MKCFEEELQEYIYNLCEQKDIPLPDIRVARLGDSGKFWLSETNSYFEPDCVNYYTSDTEDIKTLVSHIIDELWEHATQPNHRIGLYIKNIINKVSWIDVSIGGFLFEDDVLL